MEVNANLNALNEKLEAKRSINYLRFDAKKETEEVTSWVTVNGQRWVAQYNNEDGEMLYIEDRKDAESDLYTLDEVRALMDARKLILNFDYKAAVAPAQEEEVKSEFYLLVSGTRDMKSRYKPTILAHLEAVRRKYPNLILVHGDADGVDRFSAAWARQHGLRLVGYPPDWSRGNRAALVRNEEMAQRVARKQAAGHKTGCLAFPGPRSRGTHHQVRTNKNYNITTKVVSLE